MPNPITLKLDNRSQAINSLGVQTELVQRLPLGKVFVNDLDHVANVNEEGIEAPLLHRLAQVYDALEVFFTTFLRLPLRRQSINLLVECLSKTTNKNILGT